MALATQTQARDWIEDITSAWTGHRRFAEWLVQKTNPTTIVELGVDWGYSTFVFGCALQTKGQEEGEGIVDGLIYGVDLFEGDVHAGARNTYESVLEKISQYKLTNIRVVKAEFGTLAKTWTTPIDVLHIDGLHTYEAVKDDFNNWSPFVKDDGIILFHDVCIQQFGIKDFFHEVDGGYMYKAYFPHSAGLGVLTKNRALFETIQAEFPNMLIYKDHPLVNTM